ncbi:MAG TPA: SpoIIE family protein phosphatase [Solirubrobacteraceae bacterium]|nr:SpoIIE family protein phosphatase [Solirubrobacteraceae bacterium]
MSAVPEGDRFELLAAAGEVADGTLLLANTAARLLGLVVPAFADIATLDSISPGGELRRLGSRVDAPRGRDELEAALLRRRPLPDAPVGLPRAIVSSESQLLVSVTDADLHAIASSDEDFELLRALELRSALFIPLRARGRTVGALALGVGTSGRSYDEDDLRFAEVLSGRIALALDNATLSETVTGLERRLEATLTNLAEAVLVREAGGQIVFANSAAAGLLNLDSAQAATQATPQQLMELYDVFDENGRRLGLADLPSSRAGRGEDAGPLLVRNVIRATGDERWLLHKATPVFDPDGSLSLIVSVIEDLTEVKRAELAQRLLAEAGQELSSSLDYEHTLQRVAELTVPGLADWCAVAMRDGDLLAQVALAHVDVGKVARVRDFEARHPVHLGDPAGAAEVVRSGEAMLIPEITGELLAGAALTDEELALARELALRSVLIVPLAIADQAPIGALTLATAESGRRLGDTDLALAAELGRRAAIAVENARLYGELSAIATTLQRSLLPPDLPAMPGFRMASLYRAAGEQNEVGGDFYDVFEVPGGWMVVVGDVAGRGAEAAALTSLSRYTFRTAGKLLGDPIAALEQLNTALRESPALSLVSVCCVRLRTADGDAFADLVLAGHPPAYHVRRGSCRPVGVFAPFLGAYEHGGWEATTIKLDPGEQLILYTDGVIDTVGADERFGEERLARTLTDATGAADAVRRIEQALVEFAHGSQVDDTAVIAVERTARGVVETRAPGRGDAARVAPN